MVAPKRNTGTRSPRSVDDGDGSPGPRKGKGKGVANATVKSGNKNGGKKKQKGKSNYNINIEPLNPPFDPRMRRIGSPLNQGGGIKRGWIQTEEDNLRVDFLFNPSELSIAHTPIEDFRTADQMPPSDVLGISYASMGSATNVKLLYDRSYELFGPGVNGGKGFANRFGVYADVAAWYVLLGMLPEMPTNWETSIITDPPQPKMAYLFVGPKMAYYGRLAGANVTYSHWTQSMIPARCAVDIAFELLPHSGSAPLRKQIDEVSGGWRGDFENGQPDFMP